MCWHRGMVSPKTHLHGGHFLLPLEPETGKENTRATRLQRQSLHSTFFVYLLIHPIAVHVVVGPRIPVRGHPRCVALSVAQAALHTYAAL